MFKKLVHYKPIAFRTHTTLTNRFELPQKVRLTEVGCRDGLQNEKMIVDTYAKSILIKKFQQCGIKQIEATSYVNPKLVPQMADSSELMKSIIRGDDVDVSVLVPNMKGFENAIKDSPTSITLSLSASDTFSKKNFNASLMDQLKKCKEILNKANEYGINVKCVISCSFHDPFEGKVYPDIPVWIASKLFELDCESVYFADTTGEATPEDVNDLALCLLRDRFCCSCLDSVGFHFHNTYGMALSNILKALSYNITMFDTSIAGLGGCPFSPGATGNIATEDVVNLMNKLGIETGISLDKLFETSVWICKILGRNPDAFYTSARTKKNNL